MLLFLTERMPIRYAILNAKDGDVIILAGKGHEDYQEIKGCKKYPDWNERVHLLMKLSMKNEVKKIL